MYADDTVIHFAHRDINIIENILNEEIKYLSHYFYKNELILNLKKGKTGILIDWNSKVFINDINIDFS